MLTRQKLLRASLAAPALILPSRKLYAWTHGNAGPLPPAPAAAVGFNTRTFFDDFPDLSSVDTANTGAPGKKWYVRNQWTDATDQANGWAPYTNGNVTQSGDISASGSILTLNPSATNVGFVLQTAVQNGAGFNGTTFGGGFYLESRFSFDTTLHNANLGDPGMFCMPINFFLGTALTVAELDHFENFNDNTFFVALHEWIYASKGSLTSNSATTNDVPASLQGLTWTSLQTFGTLWVPASKNGGTGLISRYFNGGHVAGLDVTYSSGAPSSPGLSPSNPTGALTELDSQNNIILMQAGVNWPLHVDYVAVWQ